MKFRNRTILITGGTSGIGLALARQLLQRGNTVIVTGRDAGQIEATTRALPGIHTFQSDVGDPAAIKALHNRVVNEFPALDVLFNNAGIMRNLDMKQDRDLTDVTREIEINLSGPIRMVQQFLPHLRSRQDAAIVNTSSGLAFIPYPLSPIYCATKAAIHSFSQSLRVQLAGTSVTVIELAPPTTETPLLRGEFQQEMKDQKGMPPSVLAGRAIAGIEAGKLEIRPGLSNVLYTMSRLAPHFALNRIARSTWAKAR